MAVNAPETPYKAFSGRVRVFTPPKTRLENRAK